MIETLIVFSSVVAFIWIRNHYKLLEKGIIKPREGPLITLGPNLATANKELESIKHEKKLLEERVRNLESIVCSVDLELNARLNRLAADSRVMPALPLGHAVAAGSGGAGGGAVMVGTQPTLARTPTSGGGGVAT